MAESVQPSAIKVVVSARWLCGANDGLHPERSLERFFVELKKHLHESFPETALTFEAGLTNETRVEPDQLAAQVRFEVERTTRALRATASWYEQAG